MTEEPAKFDELAPSDQKFVRSRVVSGTRTARAWMGSFSVLAAYDKAADKKRFNVGVLTLACIPVAFALAFVLAKLRLDVHWWQFAPFGVAVVGGFFWWLRLRTVDVPNHLREFVYPLICLIGEDCDPKSGITLHLDLRGYDRTDPEVSKIKRHGRNTKWKLWHDPWFSGEMLLHDGSALQWSIEDEVSRFSYWKRSISGKMKHKTKFKTKRLVTVTLKLRQDRYAADAIPGARVRQGEKRSVFTMRSKLKIPAAPTIPAVDDVLGLVGRVYKAASPQGGAS